MTVEQAAEIINRAWGFEPHIRIACRGGSDEHWQFRRDPNAEMPDFTLIENKIEAHPDGAMWEESNDTEEA